MRHKFIYIASLLIILSSCTYEFNIDDIEAKRKPVIFCMPNTLGDTTLIQVSQSTTVNNKGTNTSAKPDITFKLNGVEKVIKYTDKATDLLPANSYYVLGKLKESDKIDLEVSYPDMPTAKSSTVIPQPFPLDKWEMVLGNGSYGREIQFRISFTDNAETKDYYGMRIVRNTITHYYGEVDDEEEIEGIDLKLDEEPLLFNKVGFDEIFDITKTYYRDIYLWDDTMLNGKSYTLQPCTYYYEGYNDNEMIETIKFKICLYRFSEEIYQYLKSINDINNNELGEYGLAPIRSHYTNIENGIGLLGGCSIYETDWIDNPKDKKN